MNTEKKKDKERVERVQKDLWDLANESLKECGTWRGKDVGIIERPKSKSGRDGGVVEIVVVSHAAFLGSLEGKDGEFF